MTTYEEDRRVWKRTKWIIYFSMVLPYLIVYFQRVSLNVVANDLMSEFRLNGVLLATLSGVYFYIYTFLQIPSGILADCWGPRKTTTAGMLVAAVGAILFGWASTVPLLFTGRIIVSLGVSFIFISILKIQSTWFHGKEFTRISGFTVLIGNAGALLAATPLVMLNEWMNWHVSFLIISVLSFVAGFIAWRNIKDHPGELGLPTPDAIVGGENVEKSRSSEKTQVSWSEIKTALGSILPNHWSWLLIVAFFGIFGSFLMFQGVWGVTYFMQVFGFDKQTAANLLAITTIGHMIGCLLVGWISDRIQKRKPVYLSFLTIYILVWTLLTFSPQLSLSISHLYFISFMLGFSVSCFILTWAWAKELNNPEYAGMSMGTVNMAGFMGAAILQLFFGYLLDKGWDGVLVNGTPYYASDSFMMGFFVNLVFIFISLICVLLMKETHNKNIFHSLTRKNKSNRLV